MFKKAYIAMWLQLAFLFVILVFEVFPQVVPAPNFRTVVNERLIEVYGTELSKVCPVDSDLVAERVFRDYGAIFVSNNGGRLPSSCILTDESLVQRFQASLNPITETVGGVAVTLQKPAMEALLAAVAEARKKKLTITPRGGTEASTRSYQRTVDLWRSRFLPGLNHWVQAGKIKAKDAATARQAPIRSQIEMVLAWENEGLFFSTDFSKSILYSVAAPGASQHIFMLALDVSQFSNRQVRQILADHGWFQTVKSDLPHFTFLGVKESELPGLGLKSVIVGGQKFWIPDF